MLPAGILRERAKFSGVDLDWRTTKEPTGLSDKISIVMSLKKTGFCSMTLTTLMINLTRFEW